MQPTDQAQRDTALDLGQSVVCVAPAGSGKTSLLTLRFLAALEQAKRPEHVLAVTFTNKAAAEMKERIVAALDAAVEAGAPAIEPTFADDAPPDRCQVIRLASRVLRRDERSGWSLRRNQHRLRVVTFDSLQMSLATELPLSSGLSNQIGVDENPRMLYEQAVMRLLEEMDDPAAPDELRESLSHLMTAAENRADRLIEPLIDLLERREQWRHAFAGQTDPDEVLTDYIEAAIRAAAEAVRPWTDALRDALQMAASGADFAAAWSIDDVPSESLDALGQWQELADLLTTREGGLRATLNKRQGLPPKSPGVQPLKDVLALIAAEGDPADVTRALTRVRELPSPAYPPEAAAFRDHLAVVLRRLTGHLVYVFAEHGCVDFSEIALRALRALGEDGEVTDALLRMDYSIQHLLVDEFQDTSRGQLHLIERLTEGWTGDDGRSLFVVGDAQQSIYAFRQAEVGLFMQLLEQPWIGGIPLTPVQLTANFRSSPEVVDWVNDAFQAVLPPTADLYHGGVPSVQADAVRTDLDGGVQVCPVISGHDSEADRVVETLKDVRARRPEARVALLVRSRSQVRSILPALRHAGVAYSATDIDPIESRTGVRDIVSMIRSLRHPGDRAAWMRLLRARCIGVTWADVLVIAQCAPGDRTVGEGIETALAGDQLSDDGRQRLERLAIALGAVRDDSGMARDLARSVRGLWSALDGPSTVADTEHEDVERVLTLLEAHCPDGVLADMRAFEVSMRRLYASPAQDGVEVMTIHRSKGLEYDVVLVAGLGEGSAGDDAPLLHYPALPGGFLVAPRPAWRAEADAPAAALYRVAGRIQREREIHERRRLLYVACTRAAHELHLFGRANLDRKGGVQAPGGSLLQLLWPAVCDHYVAAAEEQVDAPASPAEVPTDTARAERPPTFSRLVDARGLAGVPVPAFRPSAARALRPSESLIGDAEGPARLHDGRRVERAIGTVYHAFVARLTGPEGRRAWRTSDTGRWSGHAMTQLRGQAVPERHVRPAADDVVQLLELTFGDVTGRWILDPGCNADSELELAGYTGGEWVVAALDRVIYTESAIWLIDFKSTPEWLRQPPSTASLHQATAHHAQQLKRYRQLLQEWLAPAVPIRLAVYYPSLQRLVPVEQSDPGPGMSARAAA